MDMNEQNRDQSPRSDGHDGLNAFFERSREIRREAEQLAGSVKDATGEVERYLADQAKRRPYAVIGVGMAVGYVLGGGLASRVTAFCLSTASRLAVAFAAQELGAWVAQGAGNATAPKIIH